MNLKHSVLIILTGVFLNACSFSGKEKKYFVKQAPNNECCAVRAGNGQCVEELIPGCASDSSPLFKEQFFRPDDCCAYWGVDGMCYEELVKGCSIRKP